MTPKISEFPNNLLTVKTKQATLWYVKNGESTFCIGFCVPGKSYILDMKSIHAQTIKDASVILGNEVEIVKDIEAVWAICGFDNFPN